MCDTDSEEYESADEEIQVKKDNETKKVDVETNGKNDANHQESTKSGIKKIERPLRDKPKVVKLGTTKAEIPNLQQPTQCWEFETWEESQVPQSSATIQPSEPPAKVAEDNAEGWDFDDWEIEDDAKEIKKPAPVTCDYDTFPILKELSGPRKSELKDIDEIEAKLKSTTIAPKAPVPSSTLDRLTQKESDKAQSWAWTPSWSGAAVSFLSTASKSVASITTNISQAIESGMGVPNPETLARLQAEEDLKLKKDGYIKEDEPLDNSQFRFDNLVSGVTQMSSKMISGGLDTLEGIGKKTMNILQENDPGLLNKRKMLGLDNESPVLSHILREAKEKTEEREKSLKQIQKHLYKKKLHFETLFDDYHGLVHLEALEMLSKQASLKLETLLSPLTGKALTDLEETLNEVKELCELSDLDNDDADGVHTVAELESKLNEAVEDLDDINIDFKEILGCWENNLKWLDAKNENSQQVFEKALHGLAQTTALCVQRMHKLAEILLILDHHSTANEADSLVQLTTVFCWHVSGLASRFSSALSNLESDDSNNTLITNIFLEGSNSTSYIQNAFQLFIPILQIGAA